MDKKLRTKEVGKCRDEKRNHLEMAVVEQNLEIHMEIFGHSIATRNICLSVEHNELLVWNLSFDFYEASGLKTDIDTRMLETNTFLDQVQ